MVVVVVPPRWLEPSEVVVVLVPPKWLEPSGGVGGAAEVTRTLWDGGGGSADVTRTLWGGGRAAELTRTLLVVVVLFL